MKSGVAGPFAERHSEQADDLVAGSGIRPEDSNIGKENVQNPVSSQRPEEATRFDNYGGGAAPTRVNKQHDTTSAGPEYGSGSGTGYGDSNRDRDTALAGATAAAGAGGAGYAASRHQPDTYEPSGAQHAERSFPLGGGATSDSNRPTSSVYSDTSRNPAAGPTSTSGYIDPSTTSRSNNEGLGHGSAGAATAAGGAAAAGAGIGAFGEHEHRGHGHSFKGDPCPPGEEPLVSGVPQHIKGPHSTFTANLLDPHVPGEFPSEDGTDPHRSGLTGVGSSLPDRSSTRDSSAPYHAGETGFGSSLGKGNDAPAVPERSQGHHFGRDAAAAGGLGAAGVGAYELGKDRNTPATAQPTGVPAGSGGVQEVINDRNDPRDLQSTTSQPPEYGAGSYPKTQEPTSTGYPSTQPTGASPVASYDSQRASPPDATQTSSRQPQSQQPEHHYGRDAALGGGVAAAGYGAYKMTEGAGADDTGPASKTIGPHKSNVMNILDPRVQPEPEHQKQHTTAGPWHSDTVNKLDPKVQSNPEKAPLAEHGYRDAAIVGGAGTATGAAGYGAYEAGKDHGNTAAAGQTGAPYSSTNAPYGSAADGTDPRAASDPRAIQQQQPEYHYGRDAAAVGGAGAAAYAGKEAYDEKEAKKQAKEQAKEQEKHQKELEKEHEKAAKEQQKEHEKAAKEQQKEHEKDLKHQQKEQEKQAKADEKERAKAAEKAEKERAKEKEKHDKEMAKEKEKHDKEAAKEQEKLDHQHAKEQEKLEKEKAKEQEKLEKAREKEAHKHEHNKLHKVSHNNGLPAGISTDIQQDPPPEDKKPSLIHRILHPHEKDETRKSVEGDRPKGLDYKDADEARHADNMNQLEGAGAGSAGDAGVHHGIDDRGHSTEYPSHASGGEPGLSSGSGIPARDQGIVTEPHTGLPMNVGKYGSGAGGTDGAQQIHGYEGAAR